MKIIPTSIAVCTLSALLLCTAPVSATPLQGDHIPTGFPVLPRPQICQTVYFDKAPLYPEVAGFINGLLYPKIEGWSDPQSLNLVTYNGSDAGTSYFYQADTNNIIPLDFKAGGVDPCDGKGGLACAPSLLKVLSEYHYIRTTTNKTGCGLGTLPNSTCLVCAFPAN
jgi:hypothetical protein